MKNKKKNIGFIGVGYMGSGIAFNLINKGSKILIEEFPSNEDFIDTKEKIEKI